MPLQVTALYAALLALVGFTLGGLVGARRGKTMISLGDGGDRELIERNRRHMNFLENVPLILLLFAIIELNGGSRQWLHVLGATLLVGRIIHPFGIDATNMRLLPRFIGALATILVGLAAIGMLLAQVWSR